MPCEVCSTYEAHKGQCPETKEGATNHGEVHASGNREALEEEVNKDEGSKNLRIVGVFVDLEYLVEVPQILK